MPTRLGIGQEQSSGDNAVKEFFGYVRIVAGSHGFRHNVQETFGQSMFEIVNVTGMIVSNVSKTIDGSKKICTFVADKKFAVKVILIGWAVILNVTVNDINLV